jgi:hypothetical protein
MSVPELVPEISDTAKLLQRIVILVLIVSKKLSGRSEIPRERVFCEPGHGQMSGNLNDRYGPVFAKRLRKARVR